MTSDAALFELARAHGVHLAFHDLHGVEHRTSPDTARALLGALGVDAGSEASVAEHLTTFYSAREAQLIDNEHVIEAGEVAMISVRRACEWSVLAEGGKEVAAGKAEAELHLPALESGYYHLVARAGKDRQEARLLVCPRRCPSVLDCTGQEQCWGVIGALYGLRSDTNGGLGNYEDLAHASAAMGRAGAQYFGINPGHALGWAAGDMISPYSPTHRGFFNIDHIAVSAGLGPTPAASLIDYAAFRQTHRTALEAEYEARDWDVEALAKWRDAQGAELRAFCQYEAISEIHGADIRTWSEKLQNPGAAAERAAGARTEFHAWLQWRAETQLDRAQRSALASGMSLGLYLDLAVGARPGGAEVWMNPGTIAKGVTIGAPPDHLNPQGQSWALAAHAPGPLAQAFYAPLRAMLRSLMQRCGLLRIDHVLGLLRSFWLPDDGSPGGYISQPLDSLLAIIAIEAERAGCVIVGEDLGLVPDGFRQKLSEAGLYSYAVWQFESHGDGEIKGAHELAAQSLACFGTHDTPTLRGFWYAEDIAWWQKLGWLSGHEAVQRHNARARLRGSLRRQCHIGPVASPKGCRKPFIWSWRARLRPCSRCSWMMRLGRWTRKICPAQ
ncbi:MAG: 4-alpha-glucanotransferase [Litoreibacter sp.]|nr:4-alpha-glucanotransferase [Litoreibacter sp.]